MVGNFYFGWFIYNLICGVLLINFSRTVKLNQIRTAIIIFTASCYLLAIFGNAITPDYIPYQSIIAEIAVTQDPFTHIESIYIYLIHHIGNNYFIYQFILYTIQFIIFYVLISNSLNHCRFCICFMALFSIIGLYNSIGGRAYLCYVTLLYGIVLFHKHKKTAGLVLLVAGIFLHKIGIILSPLFLIATAIPFSLNKTRFILLLICIGSLVIALRYLIHNNFGELLEQVSNVNAAGANYLAKEESQNAGGSLWWKIISLYRTLFFYILSIKVLYLTYKHAQSNQLLNLLYKISFSLILLSISYLGLGLPDQTIGERLLSAATIPICIITAKLRDYDVYTRKDRYLVITGLLILLMFNNAYIVGTSHVNGI